MMTRVDRFWPAWLGKTFSWNDFKCVYMSRWCLHVCHGADMQFLQFLHEEGNGFVQLSLTRATKNHQSSNAKVRACNRNATSATPQTHTEVERTFSSFDIWRCWECDHDWWWNKSSLLYYSHTSIWSKLYDGLNLHLLLLQFFSLHLQVLQHLLKQISETRSHVSES